MNRPNEILTYRRKSIQVSGLVWIDHRDEEVLHAPVKDVGDVEALHLIACDAPHFIPLGKAKE